MTDSQKIPAWRPSVEPDTMPSLEEIIGQVVGTGSMCWSNHAGTGTFDSEKAKWATDGAIETIRKFYVERDLYADPRLPDDVFNRWVSCSRAEAIRQCEDSHAALLKAHESIDKLQGQVRELRAELANQDIDQAFDPGLGPVNYVGKAIPDEESSPWDGARDDDKIYILRTVLDSTSAQGTDMANFIRRIRLILDA